MKTLRPNFAAWLILATTLSSLNAWAVCPDTSVGETSADCPWADLARDFISRQDKSVNFIQFLAHERSIPEARKILTSIKSDRHSLARSLWGTSYNYDELAKAQTVDPSIESDILKSLDLPPPLSADPRIVHAGATHTYAYLFSVLKTPFGYKRSRWVSNDLERAFGLPNGILNPNGSPTGFLSNVTYVAGSIGLRDSKSAVKLIEGNKFAIDPRLKSWRGKNPLKVIRITETALGPDAKDVELRTDLVSSDGGIALIYTAWDRRVKNSEPVLITVFPVLKDFVDNELKPERFGTSVDIKPRFNAAIPDWTTVAKGTRVRTP